MQPRIIQLHHKTAVKLKELKKTAERDGEHRVAKRIHAVLLNSNGHTSGEIASLLDVARSRVSEWFSNYEEYGIDGLLEGHRSGRPPLLSEKQVIELSDIIESGPVAYGYETGIWTSPIISQVILDEFGISYHPAHVRKILHSAGFSVQRPKKVLARADPKKQGKWRRYTFPNLKKTPRRKVTRSSSKTKRASGKTQRSTRRGAGSDTSRKSR